MERKSRKRGVYCAALWCSHFHGCRVDKPYSFFYFPKDPEGFSQWVKFSLRHDLVGKTPAESKSYRLCSAHFHKHEIRIIGGRNILKRPAIPTIVEETLCPGNASSMSRSSLLDSKDTVPSTVDVVAPSNSSSQADILLTNDSIGNVSSVSTSSLLDSDSSMWKSSTSSTLCSKHLLEECCQVRPGVKIKLLKEDAVPSVRQPFLRLEPSNIIDKEADFDLKVERLESPSKQKCQQTQTDAVPQSPTKGILRKKIKLLQMKLNHRNKKISNMAKLIEELKKKGH